MIPEIKKVYYQIGELEHLTGLSRYKIKKILTEAKRENKIGHYVGINGKVKLSEQQLANLKEWAKNYMKVLVY